MQSNRIWGVLALLALAPANLAAEGWTPFNFQRAETYTFTMALADTPEFDALGFVLDIRESAPDPETGEAFYDLSFTTSGRVSANELQSGSALLFGGMGAVSVMAVNPMAMMFLGMGNLEVGATTDLYGAGRLEVPGKEMIAGREGYLVRLIMVEEGVETLVSEMVIDPELALPLRSVTYDDGEPSMMFEMTAYTR